MRMMKKTLAGVLAMLMLVSLVPIAASALMIQQDDVSFLATETIIVDGENAKTATVTFKTTRAVRLEIFAVEFDSAAVPTGENAGNIQIASVTPGANFFSAPCGLKFSGKGYFSFIGAKDVAADVEIVSVTYTIPADTDPGLYTVGARVEDYTILVQSEETTPEGDPVWVDEKLENLDYSATITVEEKPTFTMTMMVESPNTIKNLGAMATYDIGEAVEIHGPETYGGGYFQYWVIKDSSGTEVARYTTLRFTYYPVVADDYTATAVYTAEEAAT